MEILAKYTTSISNLKNNNNTFYFTICNPTSSCQYHAAKEDTLNGITRFCGLLTINNIPLEKILNQTVLYFLIHMKIDGRYNAQDHSIYEILLPYLAGELTEERLTEIENYIVSKVEPADWIIPERRPPGRAEIEALQILFRELLRCLGYTSSSESIKLTLYIGHLKTVISELQNIVENKLNYKLTLGD